MTRIAVYPGTFDPLTNGHVDIVERAARIFDEIIVAVAKSAQKQSHFSMNDRVSMCQEVFDGLKNVSVTHFDGLLVNFVKSKNAHCILRGVRAVSDFDFEFQLAGMNHCMAPDIETLFIPASETTSTISSTIVREIAAMGGDVSLFVPPVVRRQLTG